MDCSATHQAQERQATHYAIRLARAPPVLQGIRKHALHDILIGNLAWHGCNYVQLAHVVRDRIWLFLTQVRDECDFGDLESVDIPASRQPTTIPYAFVRFRYPAVHCEVLNRLQHNVVLFNRQLRFELALSPLRDNREVVTWHASSEPNRPSQTPRSDNESDWDEPSMSSYLSSEKEHVDQQPVIAALRNELDRLLLREAEMVVERNCLRRECEQLRNTVMECQRLTTAEKKLAGI